MTAEAPKVVLGIDAPEMKITTDFRVVRNAEVPDEIDPLFSGGLDGFLTTYIVVRSPNDGAEILRKIRKQWDDGESAWASQHLRTDDELLMRIVGITVVYENSKEWVFRIYTPPEDAGLD